MSVKGKIEFARENNWKICIYGLGQIGSGFCNELIDIFGIEVNYYCDRNTDVLETFGVDRNKKVTVNELKMSEEDTLVFVLLNYQNALSALKALGGYSHLHIITWQELVMDKYIVKSYFGIENKEDTDFPKYKQTERKKNKHKKIAVFTCITGGYDKLNIPECIEENCDYYLITDLPDDQKIENDEYYIRLNISEVVPQSDRYTPKAQNRYCKTHGYKIFEGYDYSVYLDGNLKIIGKSSELVKFVGPYGVAFHELPRENDVFSHAMEIAVGKRIGRDDTAIEMKKMLSEGFPFHYGMAECSVVICENKNKVAQQILNNWFIKYDQSLAKRDQFYLPYVLWKMGINVDEVCTLPGDLRNNGYFEKQGTHSGIQK